MIKTVCHSQMDFIDDNAFHIEISLKKGNGIKSVEFVRSIGDTLFFIEAKSSFPNPNSSTPNPDKENKTGSELFQEEIDKISDKFIHSLNLYSAIEVGVIEGGFPSEYKPPKMTKLVFVVFVLVIKDFEKSRCKTVNNALGNKIRESICMEKIWKPEVCVINHKTAIKKSFAL